MGLATVLRNLTHEQDRQATRASRKAPVGLPRTTKSICPECLKTINSRIFERDGSVFMEKECDKHGRFEDILYTDARLYEKIQQWVFEDPEGIENYSMVNEECPHSCGLCNHHVSTANLVNIDLTNRCNLNCPFCFANANVQDYVYELDLDQIRIALKTARDVRPARKMAIQYSGGEPTLSRHFLDACRLAKEYGFFKVLAATNGITFAKDLDFCHQAREAGLDILYLQFDGVDPEIYKKTRGVDLFDLKCKAVENCRKAGIKITLVPTIVKTVNDSEVGGILRFAVDNVDVVVAVSYQPVCFTGRIDYDQRLKFRYTLSDLAHDVEKQTGIAEAMRDWYPLGFSAPVSRILDRFQ